MKARNLFGILLLCFCTIGYVGCSNQKDGPESDEIWDIYPFVIKIGVIDQKGNDLLNPETEGSIAHTGIKAIYKGMVFEKDSIVKSKTKAVDVRFTGLYTWEYTEGKYVLEFGAFHGDRDYDDERIILDWNDGSKKDTVVFNHRFYWKKQKPVTENIFYLNGRETSSPIIIVK